MPESLPGADSRERALNPEPNRRAERVRTERFPAFEVSPDADVVSSARVQKVLDEDGIV
jgi:hypothetical protein